MGINLATNMYCDKLFYFFVLFIFYACANYSNIELTHADKAIQQFQQDNADKITTQYKTNVFVDSGGEGCDSLYHKCHIFLLKDLTTKMFYVYGNAKNCIDNNNPKLEENSFYVQDGSWQEPKKYATIHIKTLPCQTIKLHSLYINATDNLPIRKRFESREFYAEGEEFPKTVYYQETCLSADTLIIGYDYANQPVYLYKY